MLTWLPDPERTPVTGLVVLWPLTATPAVDAEGVLLDDRLARDVRGQKLPRPGDLFGPAHHLPGAREHPVALEFVDLGRRVPRVRDGARAFEGQFGIERREQALKGTSRHVAPYGWRGTCGFARPA